MAGRAKENFPRGSRKYLFVYLKVLSVYLNVVNGVYKPTNITGDGCEILHQLKVRWFLHPMIFLGLKNHPIPKLAMQDFAGPS